MVEGTQGSGNGRGESCFDHFALTYHMRLTCFSFMFPSTCSHLKKEVVTSYVLLFRSESSTYL